MNLRTGTFFEAATELGRRNHGVMGRRELIDMGIPSKTVDSRVNRGELDRLFNGVYKFAGSELTMEGLLMACVIFAGGGAAIGLGAAAAVWGFMKPSTTVNVLVPRVVSNVRSRVKVSGHDAWPWLIARKSKPVGEDLIDVAGIPVTTVEATLLGLAGSMPEAGFRDVFNEADRLGKIDEHRLMEQAGRSHGLRGGPLFRELVEDRIEDIATARSRLESLMMGLIRDEGLPRPEVNVMIEGHLVDFAWRAQRVIVETDGYEFHKGREAFERDTERDNELRSNGWTVLRFTYRHLTRRPDQVRKLIVQALKEGESKDTSQ